MNDGRNVSDYNSLVFCMDSSCTVVDYRLPTVTEPTARARYKANSDHVNMYQSIKYSRAFTCVFELCVG